MLYLEDKYKTNPDRRNRAAGVGGDGTDPGPGDVASAGKAGVSGGRGGRKHKEGDDGVAATYVSGVEKTSIASGGKESGGKESGGKNWIPATALAHIGKEVDQIDQRAASARRDREYAQAKWEKRNRMILHYDTIDEGNRVILSGVNEKKDSVYIVLTRIDRNFALTESGLQAGKY